MAQMSSQFLSVLILFAVSDFRVISGQRVRQFKPCGHDSFIIKDIDREANSWKGILNLEAGERTRTINELNVDLKLETRARILWPVRKGRLTASSGTFHLSYFPNPQGYQNEKFTVVAVEGFPMPNVASLVVNGENICHNPKKIPTAGRDSTTSTPPKPTPSPKTDDLDVRLDPLPLANCGKRMVQHQGLITSGQPSREGDWPWHAALHHVLSSFLTTYRCGGTLISPSIVLTAAHCVTEEGRAMLPNRLIVKLGMYNRLVNGRNALELQVFKVTPHESFDAGDLRNDIAILQLSTQVRFNNYVQPACLWPEETANLESIVGEIGTVIGWGLNEQEMLADILTQGSMPVVSVFACLESNREFFGLFLTDKNYCAGYRNGTSVCNGDSGGGMFFKRNNLYHIRGIVSLSVALEDKDVCNPQQYVLFTDVAKHLAWIKANV